MRTAFWSVAVFVACIGFWHYAVMAEWVPSLLLPSPLMVLSWLLESATDGTLFSALWVTLGRLAIGYGLGLFIGLLLGLLLYQSAVVRNTVGLTALGLQTLPSVCWAPLAILWFGQSEHAMYFVVFMGSAWAMALAVENAIHSVPPIYKRAAQVMGSRGLDTWLTVTFPAALPLMLSGAKLGWAFAWRSLMSAEIYVTIVERMGLGQLLHFGRELHAMEQVLAVMGVIVLVGLAIDRGIFVPIERYLRRSRGL